MVRAQKNKNEIGWFKKTSPELSLMFWIPFIAIVLVLYLFCICDCNLSVVLILAATEIHIYAYITYRCIYIFCSVFRDEGLCTLFYFIFNMVDNFFFLEYFHIFAIFAFMSTIFIYFFFFNMVDKFFLEYFHICNICFYVCNLFVGNWLWLRSVGINKYTLGPLIHSKSMAW